MSSGAPTARGHEQQRRLCVGASSAADGHAPCELLGVGHGSCCWLDAGKLELHRRRRDSQRGGVHRIHAAAAAGAEWVLPEEANATPAIPAVVEDGSGRERPTLITGAMAVLLLGKARLGWKEELGGEDKENGASAQDATGAEARTAKYIVELEGRRSVKVFGSSTLKGLGLVLFAGVCLSLFSSTLNLGTNDQWHTLKDGVPHLVAYTTFFYLSISCFVSGIGLNILFLYLPMTGVPKSSLKAYLNDWKGSNAHGFRQSHEYKVIHYHILRHLDIRQYRKSSKRTSAQVGRRL
ncbi:hypothetical protein ZWY2020_041970 [Hordeum vulgare]|nr:hypothetical protein ZWY2020_041970 [Hordeum vulgare]